MYGWMMMTGMAGMMAWLLPACGTTALAQCGMPCGRTQHAHAGPEHPAPPGTETAQLGPGTDHAEHGALPPCPVTGEPIALSVKTMTDDGPVYFSSEEARDSFNAHPQKYAQRASAQREALKNLPRVQVNCPVTGNPIDGKTQIFAGGRVVGFCCKRCVAQFDGVHSTEGEQRASDARLEASYTYQTRCPVSGDEIDPTVYANIDDDLRVYFCHAGHRDAFMKALNRRPRDAQPTREPRSPIPESGGGSTKKPTNRHPDHDGHGSSHP